MVPASCSGARRARFGAKTSWVLWVAVLVAALVLLHPRSGFVSGAKADSPDLQSVSSGGTDAAAAASGDAGFLPREVAGGALSGEEGEGYDASGLLLAEDGASGNGDSGEREGEKKKKWSSPFMHFVYEACGWTAFFAWSFSFYPQIWENWKTWNVEGLSFDFVSFNFIKHSSYGTYNVVLYYSKAVQAQYEKHFHSTTIPVALNDVGFSCHAVLMVCFQIIQLCTHERGNQRITFTATMILAVAVLFILVNLSIALSGKSIFGMQDWLGFITAMNHLQLAMTFIKYSPQAYYNWKRKSTEGWSVWGIVLDLTGGVFNLLQILVLCWNASDMTPLTGDAGKLGLSVETLFFDTLFILQHLAYTKGKGRKEKYEPLQF